MRIPDLPVAFALALLVATTGCASPSTEPEESGLSREDREAFVARRASFSIRCGEDSVPVLKALEAFLASLQPGVVERAGPNEALFRLNRLRLEESTLLRWRVHIDLLEVECVSRDGWDGAKSERLAQLLASWMELNGFDCQDGPAIGAELPDAVGRKPQAWDLLRDEMRTRGMEKIRWSDGDGGGVEIYGRPGGKAEWFVYIGWNNHPLTSVEFHRPGVPFSTGAANEVLLSFLKRVVPEEDWGAFERRLE